MFQRHFGRGSSVHFQTLKTKKLRYKYYKRIATGDNGNIQSDDQEEINGTVNINGLLMVCSR